MTTAEVRSADALIGRSEPFKSSELSVVARMNSNSRRQLRRLDDRRRKLKALEKALGA